MAHLVTSVIDKYHDILDNKSGKFNLNFIRLVPVVYWCRKGLKKIVKIKKLNSK